MKSLAERRRICNRLGDARYPSATRRDRLFEEAIARRLGPSGVLVDAGSGPDLRTASRFAAQARLAVGIDVVPMRRSVAGALAIAGDMTMFPFADSSVDLISMRSVVEHLEEPRRVLSDFARSLRPGGSVVALAPSRWYYASIIGRWMPGWLARRTLEFIYGPTAYDNFPTWYRANTPRAVERAALAAGLVMEQARVCPHPPDYLKFSPMLFRAGVLFDKITLAVRPLNVLQPSYLFVLRKP